MLTLLVPHEFRFGRAPYDEQVKAIAGNGFRVVYEDNFKVCASHISEGQVAALIVPQNPRDEESIPQIEKLLGRKIPVPVLRDYALNHGLHHDKEYAAEMVKSYGPDVLAGWLRKEVLKQSSS